MRNFINKHPGWFMVITVLLCVGITAGIAGLTAGFTESPVKRNPDNLITVGDDTNISLKSKNYESGLKVNVDEDTGIVKLSGNTKSNATADDLLYASVELEAGTYCLTSGYAETSASGVYMSVEADGEVLAKADMSIGDAEDGVFTLTEATTVEIRIHVAPAEYSTVTLKPVLVKGEEKGDFYKTVG